jgi:hypothetical protein
MNIETEDLNIVLPDFVADVLASRRGFSFRFQSGPL